MHYKPCSEIIGGARALLPMEDYAYAWTPPTFWTTFFLGVQSWWGPRVYDR